MPPKKETTSASSGNNFLVQAEEDKVLQAVVIADSFNERFMPITIDKPRVIKWEVETLRLNFYLYQNLFLYHRSTFFYLFQCLLPLVNVPIIEYTFEFLAISGVQEVILFCRSHSDQIKQYIR